MQSKMTQTGRDTASRVQAVVVDTSRSAQARLRPVPLTAVTLSDDFWAPRRRINQTKTLPGQFRHCEETGRLDNFRRASGRKDVPFQGIYFNDSDVYKWLEAAAWTLAAANDPALAEMVDLAIDEIRAAQQSDGYLNTYFMFEREAERWTNLRDMHELYCAGHLIQAAVAHHRATGRDDLLEIARRFADLICDTFGPADEGKTPGTCGHEEIEMALVELARATGEHRYLRQAAYFVDARGHGLIGGSPYHQDHQPFRELDRVTGHAVRAVYLTCGATDLFLESGETALRDALDRLWTNMVTRQSYVSGGIGSRYEGEAFGKDFELPNARAYTETCAAIGSLMWNWRMLAIRGEAKYADVMEHVLYNAVLPGLSLDGQSYFYQNPLADDGTHRRQEWFGCACCPPNVARLLASLPAYFYSVSDQAIWLHLYAQGSAEIPLEDGRVVRLSQQTRYPWDGAVEVSVETAGDFSLHLRIPGWCGKGASLRVNGEPIATPLEGGTYVELARTWQAGDRISIDFPMPVRRTVAHPFVAENRDHVALTRGPLLYCVEAADNPGLDPRTLLLPSNGSIKVVEAPDLLGGIITLRFDGQMEEPASGWEDALYHEAGSLEEPLPQGCSVTAIPYFAWANREAGPMQVWLRTGR